MNLVVFLSQFFFHQLYCFPHFCSLTSAIFFFSNEFVCVCQRNRTGQSSYTPCWRQAPSLVIRLTDLLPCSCYFLSSAALGFGLFLSSWRFKCIINYLFEISLPFNLGFENCALLSFIISHRFWYVLSLFSFSLRIFVIFFLISSVNHLSFSNVLFNFHWFVFSVAFLAVDF